MNVLDDRCMPQPSPRPAPSRVLFSSLAETEPPWSEEIVLLFRSLRLLGGDLATARARAYFTGPPDTRLSASLAALDVEIQVVRPVDPRCPHANKIAMLETDEDVDWTVALDTDTLVTGDLGPHLDHDAIRLRVVDASPVNGREWRRLFSHFGLGLPPQRLRTTSTGKRVIPYFNSGALLVPEGLRPVLAAAWRRYVHELLDAYDALPGIGRRHHFYTDQLALALALVAARLPVAPLPVSVNTPTHVRIHRRWRPHAIEPRLVHYHHRLGASGRVLPSGYARIDAAVTRAHAVVESAAKGAV